MFIDQLEPRQMFAGGVQWQPAGSGQWQLVQPFAKVSRTGTLFITGTSVRDTITVRTVDNPMSFSLPKQLMLEVTLSSKYADEAVVLPSFLVPQSDVKRINISSGAGDDLVVVNTGLKGRAEVHGGKGDDRLETTGRSNSLFGDSGNDILTSNTPVSIAMESVNPPISGGQRAVWYSYNLLSGGDGNDTFRTRGGDDSLVGGGGNDRYEPLEAGIVTVVATTLPSALWPSGTVYVPSRVALDSIEVLAPEPTDTSDAKVLLNGEWIQVLPRSTIVQLPVRNTLIP